MCVRGLVPQALGVGSSLRRLRVTVAALLLGNSSQSGLSVHPASTYRRFPAILALNFVAHVVAVVLVFTWFVVVVN